MGVQTLRVQLTNELENFYRFGSDDEGDVNIALDKVMQAISDSDQELIRELEGLKQDDHPIDPETGAAVETYGYEAQWNQAIDAAISAIKQRSES